MNGDGTTDLVLLQASAYNLPTSIQIRLLNSKGGSLKTITVQVSGGIASWLVRDLDGDSQPEVVVTSGSKSSKLTVYHNQLKSPGIMKATYTYSLKGSLKILDARDLDNDGPLDLIVSSSGTLHSLLVHSQGAGLAFKAKTLLMGGGGSAFFGASLGDLTAPPARGIHIKKGAFDVTISGVSAIRGYSTGILVEGNKAVLSEVTVEDTDLHGVRFSGVASGKVSSLTTRNLFQGVGLALDNATIVTVNNSDLCDAGYNPRLTAVGARCIKSAANGANNRLRLNNGCTTMATKPCP